MRVVFLTAEFPPVGWGVANFVVGLSRGVILAGGESTVLTTVRHPSVKEIGSPVRRVRGPFNARFLKIIPLFLSALRVIRHERPNYTIAMIWPHEGVACYLLSLATGVPYLVVAHGTEIIRGTRRAWRRRLMVHVLRNAVAVVANSTYTRNALIDVGIEADSIAIINPPVQPHEPFSVNEINRRFGLEGKRVVFSAGHLVRRKGHDEVIKALPRIRRSVPDVVYVVAGTGPRRQELDQLALKCGVKDLVHWVDYLTDQELWGMYERSTVYASVSRWDDGDIEGFGISLAEASFCGTPVVCGDSGGVRDVVEDGLTGYVVDPTDIAAVEGAIESLLCDGDLRARMSKSARERAHARFDVSRQGGRLLGLLDRLELTSDA